MLSLIIALVLPFIGSFFMFILRNRSHNFRGFVSFLIALVSFGFVLDAGMGVFQGEILQAQWSWFASFGIHISFYLDGLSLMFALLITGMGALVCLYAIGYLHNDRIDVLFWFSLLLFMGSMLGVVLAGDFVTLLVFWEGTSISSFLLIGINYWKKESRRGALNALFVTAGGGLCLLTGILFIGFHTGSFSIPALIASGIEPNTLMTVAMILILLGAWTKSAHFPFHFWLPQAMAAPTPISAYLHSATMVKAGIYLIARLNPAFLDHPYWSPLVMLMGLLTFMVGGLLAISQEDAKALLAYSTISQLGMISFMIGIGTEAALLGAMFHILAHATFKGALFMGAGAIDHTMGTRNLDRLGPLKNTMPLIAGVMALCSLSMAGIIPFSGFVSKEAMFEGILHYGGKWESYLLVGSVVASIFTFFYSMRLVIELPFGRARAQEAEIHHQSHGLNRFALEFPPTVLCLGTIVLGVGVANFLLTPKKWINTAIGGVGHALAEDLHPHLALWHGFSTPLMFTGIVVGVGMVMYVLLPLMRGFWREVSRVPGPESLNRIFQDHLVDVCHDFMEIFIRGPLPRYLRIMIGFGLILGIYTWMSDISGELPLNWFSTVAISYEWLPFLLLTCLALGILKLEKPVPTVMAVGGLGFVISTVFLVYRAPDLILTQISVETVSVIIFLWVLKDIEFPETVQKRFRGGDFVIALLSSVAVCVFLMTTLSVKEGLTAPALYYIENSLPQAWGANMVNVILVDFRALDTLGEIAVLGIATVGVLALLNVVFKRKNGKETV